MYVLVFVKLLVLFLLLFFVSGTPFCVESHKGLMLMKTLWLGLTDEEREFCVRSLRDVYDPEIPVNILDLGLIYEVSLVSGAMSSGDGHVSCVMSLTSPSCPVAGEMPDWVREALMKVPGVVSAEVSVTFDPPWGMDRLSEEAQLELGLM